MSATVGTRTPGRFITFEGIEGVGKTTQVARIARALEDRGVANVVTREPGGTALAEKIRDLMFAARAVHLVNHIEPNLSAGRWVICDRFTDATYAYQGAGRGMSERDIERLETLVQGKRRPDLTLVLDVPVDVGMARSKKRDAGKARDRFEREQAEFFERVRAGYLRRALEDPKRMTVIDAALPVDEVGARIIQVLESKSWIS
jgi:dTMP kinase